MPRLPTDLDPASWQRHFAMEANNRAWALAEAGGGPDGGHEMLDAAHASAWHWKAVGTQLHHMRSAMLLAQAHALLGHGAQALSYSQPMHAFFTTRDDTPDWELAFAHTIHAHALHRAGQHDAYVATYARARSALEAIADKDDKAIVRKTFEQVPAA